MKFNICITGIVFILMFILGFEYKEQVQVSIVSTSITEQGLRYDIKLTCTHCNEQLKKNLHIKVSPGADLRKLMKTNGGELVLLNESKYLIEDTGKYHLAYKMKKSANENEAIFFPNMQPYM
ncbi:hypothetical protein [Neobacillus massiliamazoniensis]|uniref:Uncharacterized protein n=1 Tax=Neobacillus massiliamazoniensis TaxID=1499688 RepID=A0A0U1NSW8_9BACI|nr:hypothetical protein [Neobacillus massiliamazoniensis]CRK81143.1 hypothetical protein BN000_01043 [Neobacillus massiliamazoniensis]